MNGKDSHNKILQYALFGILALWAGLVLFRFYQEHLIDLGLDLGNVRQLVRKIQLPPPPTDILKIAAAAKHLFLACILTVIGMLAGRRLLGMAGVSNPQNCSRDKWTIGQELVLALGFGWALLIYLTFFLGVVGGLYATTIWGLILFLVLVCYQDLPALFRDLRVLFVPDKSEKPTAIERAGTVLLLVTLFFLAIVALAPSITHDAMVYHLSVPRAYADEHKIVAVPYDLFSNTFLNLEMLYTVTLLIDDFILANLMHYIMGAATLVFLYSFARSNFGRATAALAVFIFFFNPPVLNEMPIAYVDVGMTFYFLLAMYCAWRWRKENGERWFILLCVFTGIFAGMKYTSIYGLISICVIIVAVELFSPERKIGNLIIRLALLGGIVAIFVSPYLFKNYLITGNPVYPVMYDFFGGRWLVPMQVERMLAYVDSHGMGHDWRSLLALPWNITILGRSGFANFDTMITPLWLVILPALLFIRPKPVLLKWSALSCAVYFLSWAAYTHITRYLMPIFPLCSLLCAYAVVALSEKAEKISRPLSLTFRAGWMLACGAVWLSFVYFYPLRVPWEFAPVVWGSQTPDEFLEIKVPNYPVFKYINENLPPDARLVFFWDNRGFFCERPKIGDTVLEAPGMIELVHEAGSAAAFHKMLREMGFTHILFNELFLTRFPPHTVSAEDHARFKDDLKIFNGFLEKYCVPVFTADWATLYVMRG